MLNKIVSKIKSLSAIQEKEGFSGYPYIRKYNLPGTEFDFWITDETARQWYDNNFWEKSTELTALKEMIHPADSVFEFGTHYGFMGVYICKQLSEEGKFTGVELLPMSALYSQAQLSLNNIGKKAKIINAAGADRNGTLHFNYDKSGNGSVSSKSNSPFTIQGITGDSILEKEGRINFLKIDVEGFEVNILKGCTEILKTLPKISIEIHIDLIAGYGKKTSEIFELIPIDKYTGKYFHHSSNDFVPPDSHTLMDFDLNNFPTSGIVNLFLTRSHPL